MFVVVRSCKSFRSCKSGPGDKVFKLCSASRGQHSHSTCTLTHHLTPGIVFWCAQIHASAEALRLITFDADGTLYADGHHFEQDNEMIQLFMSLMKVGVLLFLAAWLHLCACR
jgi:hypothetical protein